MTFVSSLYTSVFRMSTTFFKIFYTFYIQTTIAKAWSLIQVSKLQEHSSRALIRQSYSTQEPPKRAALRKPDLHSQRCLTTLFYFSLYHTTSQFQLPFRFSLSLIVFQYHESTASVSATQTSVCSHAFSNI